MRHETTANQAERENSTLRATPQLIWLLLAPLTLMPTGDATGEVAPEAPAALIAVAGDREARLSWSPVPGVTGYAVGRREADRVDQGWNAFETVASDIRTTKYVDTGLENGIPYHYVVRAESGTNTSVDSNLAKATPVSLPLPGEVKWPLSGSTEEDADGIAFQYGPRRIGSSYDFHAGIDIPAPSGTPVHPVMNGIVTEITPTDGRRGAGNKVLVSHRGRKWTAYLHLDAFAADLAVGQFVEAGRTVIGYVGRTGAMTNHLHLTYMVGLLSESTDETRSKNPLEILPHSPPGPVGISFDENGDRGGIEIALPAQHMTARWIILKGEGRSHVFDYYQVVERGNPRRNAQRLAGMYLDASRPRSRRDVRGGFQLFVEPDPREPFKVERIVIRDFNGDVIGEATAPE